MLLHSNLQGMIGGGADRRILQDGAESRISCPGVAICIDSRILVDIRGLVVGLTSDIGNVQSILAEELLFD